MSEWTDEQKANLNGAIWSGFSALMFVTDQANWPAFAAAAEQRTPGLTWGEEDRLNMRYDAKILHAIAKGSTPRDRR